MAWYDEAVFYHIYPLGLCGCAHENDGQPTPGAFAKLEAWAAHAAKLGCTAIYIGPLFESGSHGYDTIDYRLVDRRLGTNEEFKAFVAALSPWRKFLRYCGRARGFSAGGCMTRLGKCVRQDLSRLTI